MPSVITCGNSHKTLRLKAGSFPVETLRQEKEASNEYKRLQLCSVQFIMFMKCRDSWLIIITSGNQDHFVSRKPVKCVDVLPTIVLTSFVINNNYYLFIKL